MCIKCEWKSRYLHGKKQFKKIQTVYICFVNNHHGSKEIVDTFEKMRNHFAFYPQWVLS
jgi:hypothetical protein